MDSVKLGKKIVSLIIVIVSLMNVISIIGRVVNGQADEVTLNVFSGLAGFVFTGSILYFFYLGHKLAKRLTVILILFNGIVGFLSLISGFDVVVLVIDIIYIAIGVVLIKSSSVNSFLTYQDERTDIESES